MSIFKQVEANKHDNIKLVENLRAGSVDAFTTIYNLFWRRIFAIAYKKLKSKEIAEELVQDLFVNLWKKKELLQINNLEHYLFASIKNAILDYYGALSVENKYINHTKNLAPYPKNYTEEIIYHNELSYVLEESVHKLPLKSQEIFRMSRFENLSIKDIASKLKLSEKSVEYHLTKALKMLRILLKDFILFTLIIIFTYLEVSFS